MLTMTFVAGLKYITNCKWEKDIENLKLIYWKGSEKDFIRICVRELSRFSWLGAGFYHDYMMIVLTDIDAAVEHGKKTVFPQIFRQSVIDHDLIEVL